jgi:hypothetical protein
MARRPSTRVIKKKKKKKEGCRAYFWKREGKKGDVWVHESHFYHYPKVQHTPGRRRAEIARARRQHKLLGTRYF